MKKLVVVLAIILAVLLLGLAVLLLWPRTEITADIPELTEPTEAPTVAETEPPTEAAEELTVPTEEPTEPVTEPPFMPAYVADTNP